MSTKPETENIVPMQAIPKTKLWRELYSKDYRDSQKHIAALAAICKKHNYPFSRAIGEHIIARYHLNTNMINMVKLTENDTKP